jgi:molybdopterin synthase catalytic subunit
VKTEAPFWKKRQSAGKGAGGWVEAKPQDHAAAQK